MPPTFGDLRGFCAIDGWEQTKTVKKKTGDHFRYRKVLEDGTILRTRASHGNDEIADPGLWARIWRHQLGLESEDRFWEALKSGEPVPRAKAAPGPPQKETLPAWLYRELVMLAGVPEAELAELTLEEAIERRNLFRAGLSPSDQDVT